MKRVGDAIKRGREMRKLTQQQLAKSAGVAQAHLSDIERGEAQPTFIKLCDIAIALDLPLDFFIPDEYRKLSKIPPEKCVTEKVISQIRITGDKMITIMEKDYVENTQ